MDDDDYGANLKEKNHKDAHGAKEMQLKVSHQLFICDDVKVFFNKNRNIGDDICGKLLKVCKFCRCESSLLSFLFFFAHLSNFISPMTKLLKSER